MSCSDIQKANATNEDKYCNDNSGLKEIPQLVSEMINRSELTAASMNWPAYIASMEASVVRFVRAKSARNVAKQHHLDMEPLVTSAEIV